MTTQNNNDSVAETASNELHEISDNGSVILGWMVIAIMLIFGAISVATHEPAAIDVVESNGITPTARDEAEAKGVTHSIDESKPQIVIENDENLIHTRLQI